jgi:hypothetical protein
VFLKIANEIDLGLEASVRLPFQVGEDRPERERHSPVHRQAHKELHAFLRELLPALVLIPQAASPRSELAVGSWLRQQRKRKSIRIDERHLHCIRQPLIPKRGLPRPIVARQDNRDRLLTRRSEF